MWSLSIEEQWYVVWPLIFLMGMRFARGRRPRLAWALSTVAVGSIISMRMHYWKFDPNRAYLGTDARAFELIAGAVLALTIFTVVRNREPIRIPALNWSATICLSAMAYMTTAVKSNDRIMYPWGFVVFTLLSAVVIAAATLSTGPLQRLLAKPVVVAIGAMSYGLYLFHPVIFSAFAKTTSAMPTVMRFGIKFAMVGIVAACSLRWVERPVRSGSKSRGARILWYPATAAVLCVGIFLLHEEPRKQPLRLLSPGALVAYQQLSASQAHGSRTLIFGESLVFAMEFTKPPVATDVAGGSAAFGLYGCGVLDHDIAAGNSLFRRDPACATWPDALNRVIAAYRPDVVVVMIGDQDNYDRVHGRQLVKVGSQEWEQDLNRALDVIRRSAARSAARIVIANQPCPASATSQSPLESAARSPRRRTIVNKSLKANALRHRSDLHFIDLATLLCPGGHPIRSTARITIWSSSTGLTTDGLQYLWTILADQSTHSL